MSYAMVEGEPVIYLRYMKAWAHLHCKDTRIPTVVTSFTLYIIIIYILCSWTSFLMYRYTENKKKPWNYLVFIYDIGTPSLIEK